MNKQSSSFAHVALHSHSSIPVFFLLQLYELLQNVEKSDVANEFYKTYLVTIVQDVLAVLTDTFHKPGFRLQSQILAKLYGVVESGSVTVPLWGNANNGQQFSNNQQFIRQFSEELLRDAFQQVTPAQISQFVQGLFQLHLDINQFKQHLRDFLVQLKEFSADNEDLYLEERERQLEQQKAAEAARVKAVPGLDYVPPSLEARADGGMPRPQ